MRHSVYVDRLTLTVFTSFIFNATLPMASALTYYIGHIIMFAFLIHHFIYLLNFDYIKSTILYMVGAACISTIQCSEIIMCIYLFTFALTCIQCQLLEFHEQLVRRSQ